MTEPSNRPGPASWLDRWLAGHEPDLVAVRRHLHAHPELGHAEHATTALLADRLSAAGLSPKILPGGTGLWCDVGGTFAPDGGPGDGGPGDGDRVVALRADIDALPLDDPKPVPYRSTVPGVCHACGHDAHTAILLGAALVLAAGPGLPGRVRVVFQPAEERVPGGALDAIDGGVLDGVTSIYALHCDPRLETGRVGLRTGPITAACDAIEVCITGPGGHTARPHLTVDLVHVLGEVISRVPGLLSRAADPRDGMSLVWGAVQAGSALNIIPRSGSVRGTVRMLRREAWQDAEPLLRRLVTEVAAPTGAGVEIGYVRGVPPVVNDAACTAVLTRATTAALGPAAVAGTEQSLGGEDFGWYLDVVPGSLARLGVREPAAVGPPLDIHQPTFDIDERALAVGVRLMVHTALAALAEPLRR